MKGMTPRGAGWPTWLALAALAGCGSGNAAKPDAANPGDVKPDAAVVASQDADFSVCSGTPAVPYSPGLAVVSASGSYRASVQSAVTVDNTGNTTPTAAIGSATFTVAVGAAADGGAGAPTDGLTMSIPPSPAQVPADPYMPVHKHGASTIPTITPQGGGVFTVAGIDFFMGGYWELYLDLLPAGGSTTDRLTFQICIPND